MILRAGLYAIHPHVPLWVKLTYQVYGLILAIGLLVVGAGLYKTKDECSAFRGHTYDESTGMGIFGIVAGVVWIGMACYFLAIYKRLWFYETFIVKRRLVNDVEDVRRGTLARDGNAISARTTMLAMKTDARVDGALSDLHRT